MDAHVTSMGARVSVVMMTRDRREQALRALTQLTALPEAPPIIVVDNGSADGTADAVRDTFPAVTVLSPGHNLGAAARTLGVRAAATPYVAFSDDDSWWAPGALRRAADHFDATPRLGLLAARLLVGPQEQLDPVCPEMAESPLGQQPDLPGPSVLGFLACGAVVRRRAYLQVGGFHPVVFFCGEETVLAQDLAAAGWGLSYVDDVVAHHHPEAGPERGHRRRLQTRNALLSVWLRRPFPVALARTAKALRVERPAVADLARLLPAALAARQPLPVQVERQVRCLEASHG
ncbi:MAG: glycosyltransferase [Actinomycetota bacterium]|nr:glycosyltransferase [Actinomycetota bacterium]